MSKQTTQLFFLLLLPFMSSGTPTAELTNAAVLDAYLEHYNQHNIDGMLEYMAADVRWMNIDGNTLAVATTGKDEFRAIMEGYFEHFPSASSTLAETQSVGDFIATVEKAAWNWEGTPRSQCAMSIYSFKDNLIVNVWYHIAQPCDE